MLLLAGLVHSRPRNLYSKLATYLFVVSGMVLVVMSQSRTSWLLAIAYMAYVVFVKIIRRFANPKEALFITAISAFIVSLLIWLVTANLSAISFHVGKDPTLSGRTAIWRAVMVAISKHPLLGYGYGAFWHGLRGESGKVWLSIGFPIYHAHNGYLNVWLQVGIAGLLLVVWSLVLGLHDGFRCFRLGTSDIVEWYIGLLFLTIIMNIDESTLLAYNALTTVLFVMACVGLAKIAGGQWYEQRRDTIMIGATA
jgi:O-antigen ligase